MSFIVTTRPPSLVVMSRCSSTPELTKLGHDAAVGFSSLGPSHSTKGSVASDEIRPVAGSQSRPSPSVVGNPSRFWLMGLPEVNRPCAAAGS